MNRHASGHASDKLTDALLAGYDQVWFFGVEQCNLPWAPENELTDDEVKALRSWMDAGGGVLMTGDHSNPRPFMADPNLDSNVNLGRALGHRVPRAGQLRRWEGLPTANVADSHNTQVGDGVHSLDDLTLQDDAIPQQLILRKYSVGWHFVPWLRRYRPHPLFCGRGGPIDVFPDHMHEGQLEIPASLPAADWPSGPAGQPAPEIVASGTDKRDGAVYGVASAYDGAAAGVGRIVADSTWHHYFNINLVGFGADPAVQEKIADYFVNLAVWLSPPGQREQMRCWNWWYLATHPTVRMVALHPFHLVGLTALDVLGRRAGQCLITELTWPWPVFELERERFPWPPEELVLGSILTQYHRAFEQTAAGDDRELPDRDQLVADGVRAALEEHVGELRRSANAARRLTKIFDEKDEFFGRKG